MNIIASILIFLAPMFWDSPSVDTNLTSATFESLKSDSAVFHDQGQIIYMEKLIDPFTDDDYYLTCHIYGDGPLLISLSDKNQDPQCTLYSAFDENAFDVVAEYVVDNDMLSEQSFVRYYTSQLTEEYTNYLLTIRFGDCFYTLEYTQEEGDNDSEWRELIDYMRDFIYIYSIEEFAVTPEEYISIKDAQEEKYGRYVLVADEHIRALIADKENQQQ